MVENDQDGIASFPQWFRSLLVRVKLSWALALFDEGGKHHDTTIPKLGLWLAWLWFSVSLVYNTIATVLITPFLLLAMMVYILLPQKFKDKYWEITQK